MDKKFSHLVSVATMIVMLHSGAAKADREPAKPEDFDQDFHYKLVMSEDDTLCKPLAKLYNQMLTELVQTYREGKGYFYSEGYARKTDFEYREAKQFASIDLIPPKKIEPKEAKEQGDQFTPGSYQIDLFHEGAPRIVIIRGQSEGSGTYDSVLVLKRGAKYREIRDEDNVPVVDPSIVEMTLNPLSENGVGMEGTGRGYALRKWPNTPEADLPILTGTITSIFLKSGVPYFVDNQPRTLPLSSDFGSIILVYKIVPNDRDDVCYLNLVPSTNKTKESSHD